MIMMQILGSAGHKNKIQKECGNVAVLLHLLFSFFFRGEGVKVVLTQSIEAV